MRYHLRTLLIVLAIAPPIIWWLAPTVREAVQGGWWMVTRPATETISTDAAGRISVNGKYCGRANPGDRVSLQTRGHVTWEDVDLVNNVIHIQAKDGWKPKSGDARVIHMSPVARALFDAVPKTSQWVFTARPSAKYPVGDH